MLVNYVTDVWSVCYAVRHKTVECPSVRPSVPSIDSSSSGGGEFAAEVGRGQQISTDSSCCRATCGPRKFWSDYKEVQLLLESGFLLSGKVPNSLKFGI